MNAKIPGPSPDLQSCPCGSGHDYLRCCGPLHAGAPAPTAEALMRSRYSAYVLGLRDYLMATWHPRTRPENPESGNAGTRWLGLRVKRHAMVDDDHAIVDFVARCREAGAPAQRLHEIARFERLDGRWVYVDGVFPEAEAAG